MKTIKEVIVVEGKGDSRRIKEVVRADTIETNGSAIDDKIIDQIRHAQEKRGVIIFTDPDFSGEQIRKIISRQVPGVKHAFLSQEEAKHKSQLGDDSHVPMSSYKHSLGIEHASNEAIETALGQKYTEQIGQKPPKITMSWLRQQGLVDGENSAHLRSLLGDKLRIGYTNAKQLQKRLALFHINQDQVIQALEEVKKD
ncbi:ribonuclease M5 [Alloiococcus otitis]|uniref:Ribonuclease M5 n=1 Tax=Alloiococcus otitis ATCC 51267 TaxID=883081 RepID=K9E8D0_9LACT|nr:ribonuclease M5 [Alloiococcus otitis]EKU92898.1 ribonuclease M5 [Alloiococcus otitis ATCC 51267]SUU80480.1 ribonuclease M5 [Alloiococcus otitis]